MWYVSMSPHLTTSRQPLDHRQTTYSQQFAGVAMRQHTLMARPPTQGLGLRGTCTSHGVHSAPLRGHCTHSLSPDGVVCTGTTPWVVLSRHVTSGVSLALTFHP